VAINMELAEFTNAVAMVGADIPTYTVRDKATGKPVVVDDRTFNPALHEALDAAPAAAEAATDEAETHE